LAGGGKMQTVACFGDSLIYGFPFGPRISWLAEVHKKYPLTIAVEGGFTTYAVCELETYSDATLNLYYRDIFLAATQKRNLVEERYQYLYGNLGFKDLEEVEALAQKRAAVKE
jgi:hypothetical protein